MCSRQEDYLAWYPLPFALQAGRRILTPACIAFCGQSDEQIGVYPPPFHGILLCSCYSAAVSWVEALFFPKLSTNCCPQHESVK
eukprot:307282-Amphidinium_carterae.1